ncbi:mitochondrial import inner membrane translocase subunit Tim54 [Phlebopus sp. FC_14]|nr:mitochondrial import inner membrane translocase subunit Tim54 [Phlebopus sp. FC_14]
MDASPPPRRSGIRLALEYTGIPASWLSARPRLPSRNWCIFLTFTTSFISYYAYDRRQARTIRATYVDRVKHLSEEPMSSMQLPRKVVVYGAKCPGDEDYQRAIKFFKKYIKPVFVAAAIDYDIVATPHTGDLTNLIASSVINQRRVALGLDHPAVPLVTLPNQLTPEQKRVRELEGGTVIIGRHTLKEYMAGLKKGWTGGVDKIDREESLALELASDGTFDEPEELPPGIVNDPEGEPIPTPSRLPSSLNVAVLSPLKLPVSSSRPPLSDLIPMDSPIFPAYPPLLLVPFTNYVGFRYIPHMIWDFLNERHKVRAGCEAACALIDGQTREFQGPDLHPGSEEIPLFDGQSGDLDFLLSCESFIRPHSPLSNITSSRKSYYASLPDRLSTARQLARSERERTKEEEENPPPSEVELRAERLKKELRWRDEEMGWEIVRPESGVSWDERFRGALKIFEPSELDKGSGEKAEHKQNDGA